MYRRQQTKPSQRRRKARRQTVFLRLLCSWDPPGKNTGVVCHSLLQRTVLTQGLNPGLLHCRQILNQLSHREVLAKERRELKSKGGRERYMQLNADFRTERREIKALNERCIKLENNRRGKTGDVLGKMEISREYFAPRWAQ